MSRIQLIRTSAEMTEVSRQWREEGLTVCLVPTMGALHRGHTSLVELALSSADRTVVSIFVNPTQFGPGEDLEEYPRTLEQDLDRLRNAGAHCVFVPSAAEIYPEGYSTIIRVRGLTEHLCGKYRKGHFDGVTTVCAILFGIVRPHMAVFGMKDAQQLAVIRRMTADLRMDLRIIQGETVREPDGLAMSSRNSYLDAEERAQASVIFRALELARVAAENGEQNSGRITALVEDIIGRSPLARIQYVQVVDPGTMEPLERLDPHGLLAVAVYFGNTRLIDNTILKTPET